MVHALNKGKAAEREVVNLLEPIVQAVYKELDIGTGDKVIQRNQNQSSVGGCDLSNTFGLAIEVKRQETLNLNAWWKQTCKSAERNQELPVLIYRQSHKSWNVVMHVAVELPYNQKLSVVGQISIDDFLIWFEQWVRFYLMQNDGATPRV